MGFGRRRTRQQADYGHVLAALPDCGIWEAGHDPRYCADPGCDRLACRGYRLGYQDGYRAGYAAGYAAGFAAGQASVTGR